MEGVKLPTVAGSTNNVHTDNMFKLPQFYYLGAVLTCVASGGMTRNVVKGGHSRPVIEEINREGLYDEKCREGWAPGY